jgi:hypothetical protein
MQRIRAAESEDAVGRAFDPGNQGSVVKARDELHSHRHLATQAFDDANELRCSAVA